MPSLTRLNSPGETPNTHYMMLHWGLLPRLTTEVVAQGLDTIKTSRNEANTSPMGVQQHTMIIYIRIFLKLEIHQHFEMHTYIHTYIHIYAWDIDINDM